jgi:hypothetical protein
MTTRTHYHAGNLPGFAEEEHTHDEADLSLTDVTTNNATSLKHGFLPKLSGNASDVFRGDGTYSGVSASAPTDATYIVQTASAGLSNEQALSSLSTGLVKVTNGTGVLSTASAGTDYSAASHSHAISDVTNLQTELDSKEDVPTDATFTPGVSFGATAAGGYSIQRGDYSRIGNRVFFTLRVVLSSKGAGSGAATITGLPLTCANVTGGQAACAIGSVASMAAGTVDQVVGFVQVNTTTIVLQRYSAGTATGLTEADFTDTSGLIVSGHYRV